MKTRRFQIYEGRWYVVIVEGPPSLEEHDLILGQPVATRTKYRSWETYSRAETWALRYLPDHTWEIHSGTEAMG